MQLTPLYNKAAIKPGMSGPTTNDLLGVTQHCEERGGGEGYADVRFDKKKQFLLADTCRVVAIKETRYGYLERVSLILSSKEILDHEVHVFISVAFFLSFRNSFLF